MAFKSRSSAQSARGCAKPPRSLATAVLFILSCGCFTVARSFGLQSSKATASLRLDTNRSGLDPVLERRVALSLSIGPLSVHPLLSLIVGTTVKASVASAAVASDVADAFNPLPSVSASSICSRLVAETLVMPSPSRPSNGFAGAENLYFPSFLEGEWSVTQTLVSAKTPLGLKFLGGPNGSEAVASASVAEVKKQLMKPVSLRLRYLRTKWGVAEDRLYNTRQRLDAFAGKSVVASVEYADVNASNRASVLQLGGTEEDPLQTVVARFRGPAAQKTFVLSLGSEELGDGKWCGYELDRSIFALTNQSTAPPVTTDSELVWYFDRVNDDTVRGGLRIAGYLNAQSDSLYFEARNRAVSLQDYDLKLERSA